jgi:hypothetical protein
MYPLHVPYCLGLQEFRRNTFGTDSVDEALDLLNFCHKILEKSGLAEVGTYLPKAIHPKVGTHMFRAIPKPLSFLPPRMGCAQ